MFSPKPYTDVNREERHFGFIFASALIHNRLFRERFCALLTERTGATLAPDSLDCFAEVALLRDYWRDLGDPGRYTPDTHARRRRIIELLLADRGYDPEVIDRHQFFWTSAGRDKLWCPSEWAGRGGSLNRTSAQDLASLERTPNDLLKLRWCFNAKPDFLLVSGNAAVMLELKVESPAGRRDDGYDQMEIQRLIARYVRMLVAAFHEVEITQAALTLGDDLASDSKALRWDEVVALAESLARDDAGMATVHRHLRPLGRYGSAPTTGASASR